MAITVIVPTGISASGSGSFSWINTLIRQGVTDATNPQYVRLWQLNNNMLLLSKGNFQTGVPISYLVPMLAALVPQITWPPQITLQPINLSVVHPAGGAFSIAATGELDSSSALILPITYQWQSDNGTNGTTWTNTTDGARYSGSATLMLTILATTISTPDMNLWQYRCLVTNASGTTTSLVAILSVT